MSQKLTKMNEFERHHHTKNVRHSDRIRKHMPLSHLFKSVLNRYRPGRNPVGPITVLYSFKQNHSIGPYSAMTFLSLICIVDKSLSFVVLYRMCRRQIYFLLLIFDILDLNHSVSAFLSIFIIIGSYLDGYMFSLP